MRFSIGSDKVYQLSDIEDISLRDLLALQEETARLGRSLTMVEIRDMERRLGEIKDDDERGEHPDAIWMVAVTIWAARRKAGEDVTFEDGIDFPLSQLKFLPEPADRAKKDKGPTRARPGSGRAAKPRQRAAS